MKSRTKKNKKRMVSLIRTKESSLQLENLLKRLRKKGLSALINLSDDERQQVSVWSQEVISEYATLIEKTSMSVRDVKKLPFVKKDIKMAIKIVLPNYVCKSAYAEIEALKNLYVELGSFQDISKKDKERLSMEKRFRNSTSQLSNQDHFPTIDKYKEQAVSEHNTLFQEFNFYNTLIGNINHFFKR
ncbi:MAG: hypothetical protein PVG06_08820 [Desulfobacterales bacterium]